MPTKYVTPKTIERKLASLKKDELLPIQLIEELKSHLLARQLTAKQLNHIIKDVLAAYEDSLVQPGEAVGAVAAQSIGEPGTQMSIPGNVEVIICKDNRSDIVPIGDFIDNLIASAIDTQSASEPSGSIVVNVPSILKIYVLGLDSNEKVRWQKISQVSRHLPNGNLLKITTRSGRTITATYSHSFVIRHDNKIIPIKGEDLKLGDRIPVVIEIPSNNPLTELPIELYLGKDEVWFGSEIAHAIEAGAGWREDFGISFTVPVTQDSFYRLLRSGSTTVLEEGYVYPKAHHSSHTMIPEIIPLSPLFGWFIGAYLAEGANTGATISISNNNENYQKHAIEFAEDFGLNYRLIESNGEYGPSESLIINSTLLARLFNRMCGSKASTKFVPPWVINTEETFISSVLQAYFDGDGNINIERRMIRASSSSEQLIDGICLLLARLGIFASKSTGKQYSLHIPSRFAPMFRDKIGLIIPKKMRALNKLAELEETRTKEQSKTYDLLDMIPGFGRIFDSLRNKLQLPSRVTTKLTRKQRIGRRTLNRYVLMMEEKAKGLSVDVTEELSILRRAYTSEVLWDEIVNLESIPSPTHFVYDFTVPNLETFTTSEGLVTHNTLKTFHFAGVAEFNVTLGLPRLIEIVDARRNPSTPTMNVFLDEKYSKDEKLAREVAQDIEQTRVERVAKSVEIDLAEGGILVELDPDLMENKGVTPEIIREKLSTARPRLGDVTGKGKRVKVKPELREGEEATHMAKLQKTFEKVRTALIKGHAGVKRVLIKKEGDNLVLYTEGTNLRGALRTPGVDKTRTTSNHIHEIADTLGIEAARQVIIQEAKEVLEEQGLDVDIRHIMLVADLMTTTGEIRQIGRHGISGEQSSVLARAAFEVTVKHLINAAVIGEEDPLRGITENVIIGQLIPIGTGGIDLMAMPQKTKSK